LHTYAISWTHPFDSLYLARQAKLTGVSLHYAHFNPLTYHFAKRAGLEMIMSPVPSPWLAKALHRLYPKVMITTDFPDKLVKARKPKNKSAKRAGSRLSSSVRSKNK
jgi:hypothetical protein